MTSLHTMFTAIFVIFFSFTHTMEMRKSPSLPQNIQKDMSFITKAKRSNSEPIITVVTKRSSVERMRPFRACNTKITSREVEEFNETRKMKIVQNKIIEESK